jgi:hypothetical protein
MSGASDPGLVLQTAGHVDEAFKAFDSVLEVAPEHMPTMHGEVDGDGPSLPLRESKTPRACREGAAAPRSGASGPRGFEVELCEPRP